MTIIPMGPDMVYTMLKLNGKDIGGALRVDARHGGAGSSAALAELYFCYQRR